MKIFAPTPNLGYGYNESAFQRALDWGPDVIAVDGGSTDPGPFYLGSGKSFTDPDLVRKDLRPMLRAGHERGIPILVGTAGGAGGQPHLQDTREIVETIAREEGYAFRLALIHAEQAKSALHTMYAQGRIRPLYPVPPLTEDTIEQSTRVVGLMGVEPFIEALELGADVVLAGRSDDAAIYASCAIHHGVPVATAWLAGKFLECGGACAVPRHGFGFDGLLATLEGDELLLEPSHEGVRCTVQSISSFLLHENESPVEHQEPSGRIDLNHLELEQVDERTVRLRGARFIEDAQKSIRLEGVTFGGHRTAVISWTRDPYLIADIDNYLERAHKRVATRLPDGMVIDDERYRLSFRVIGRDAVMGAREPLHGIDSHEIGIIIDAVAPTRRESEMLAACARTVIKNSDFPGKLCDEGCITFPYSPSEMYVGPLYTFSIWHTVAPADMQEMFPIELVEVG